MNVLLVCVLVLVFMFAANFAVTRALRKMATRKVLSSRAMVKWMYREVRAFKRNADTLAARNHPKARDLVSFAMKLPALAEGHDSSLKKLDEAIGEGGLLSAWKCLREANRLRGVIGRNCLPPQEAERLLQSGSG